MLIIAAVCGENIWEKTSYFKKYFYLRMGVCISLCYGGKQISQHTVALIQSKYKDTK